MALERNDLHVGTNDGGEFFACGHHGILNARGVKAIHGREPLLFRKAKQEQPAFPVGECGHGLRDGRRQLAGRFLDFARLRILSDFS